MPPAAMSGIFCHAPCGDHHSSGPGDDQVNSGLDGLGNQFIEILDGIHDVHADDAVGCGFRFEHVFLEFIGEDTGAADHTNTSTIGHRNGKGGSRHANGHAALNQRY